MQPNPQSVATASATGGAILVVAHDGRVRHANAAACALWQAKPAELIGDLFPHLFAFDVVSQDPDLAVSQWEVLIAAAAERPISLRLQPKERAELDVFVRLENAGGDPLHYLAYVSLPAPSAPAAPPPTLDVTGLAPEHFLNLLTARSSLGFFDLNFLKREVYYSPTWKRVLGYAEDDLGNTYETWLALIHPDDSAAAPDRQGRTGTTGFRQFSHEFRMKHAEGHYVWLHCIGVQHYGPNGALQRVVGVQLDIGDRKEAEESGYRAEERLREYGHTGRAGLFDLDFSAGLYWLSPGFKSYLGYADHELPNTLESVLRSLPMEETAGGLPAYFLSQHPTQPSYLDVINLRHREERDVPVQACIIRHISRKKELSRVFGFVLPLTDAASTGPNEGFSATHLSAVMAELHEGVVVTDAQGQIVHLNAKAEKLLGTTLAAQLGLDAGGVFRLVHLQTGQPGENPIAKALATGEPTTLNTEFALDVGAAVAHPVVFSARAVIDAAGQTVGAVVVFRSPGEMSLTPEELIRANRFESLGQLAGGISHDFNNLLTTILGGVSLAKDNRDYTGLDNSERACIAAKALSKQLLTFARGGTAVRQVLRTADILADTVRLAGSGTTVKIDVQVAPDAGSLCVDRAQIMQVFQNLIINAIQAMPTGQGQIWIKAANVALAQGEIAALPAGMYASIEVRDNGSGIKPEHIDRIFEPFFSTKKTGTGLGLATVLAIVKRHGGQMGVESEPGVGTAFTVFLPLADQPGEVEARRAPAFNYAKRTGRVLFMDDDPSISELTGSMLEGLGYKYDLTRNGEEAVQFYKRYLNIGRPYDLVILDLNVVGGLGGEQAFRILRDLHPEVRAIVASGYDNDEMARQFLEQGFLGYLTKPYRVGDLGRMIKKVLGA